MTEPEKREQTNIRDVFGSVLSGVFNAAVYVINVIDEKVIKRLNIEMRFWFIFLTILFVGGIISLYFALRPNHPTQMPGEFRIAVAGFSENGRSRKSKLGMQIAEEVHRHLKKNFAEADLDPDVTVWGPNEVGTIDGLSREDRTTAAAQLAEKIGADIVVYGSVDISGVWLEVTPEFYISPRVFYDAEEIMGYYKLDPVRVSAELGPASRGELNKDFAAPTNLLFQITMGLVHFQRQEYTMALETFTLATTMIDAEDKEIRKVAYLWLGNTAGRLFEVDKAETYFHLDEAEAYHQWAIDLDPDYARPYIGLAGVYYLRSLLPFQETLEPTDVDADWLYLAIDTYQQALQAENHPPLSDIETKVHFGLGQCFTALGIYSGDEAFFDTAIVEFTAVIAAYNNGSNPRVCELAAEANARLGLIYCYRGDATSAILAYKDADSLSIDSEKRESFQRFIERIESEGCN